MISDGSGAGFQAGGPVGVRAVPTELGSKSTLGRLPGTMLAGRATTGCSATGRSRGGLPGGSRSAVSTDDRRDKIAKCHRLGRRSCGRRPLPLEISLRDECFRQGGNCRHVNRQGWPRDRSDYQESGETCCKAATQLPRPMPSPADKHLIVSCAADGPESGHGHARRTRISGPGHGRLSSPHDAG